MNNIGLYLGVLMLCQAANTWAGDRLEYGITFTDTGLIDHVSGLEWLDSALTDGNLDDLQLWLDAGWRIATEEEFFFLATRVPGQPFGGSATSNLNPDGSGLVNFADLSIVRNHYLGPPGPSGLPDNCDAAASR